MPLTIVDQFAPVFVRQEAGTMSVHALMTSDQSRHQAAPVGQGVWVVTYLRGRKLTESQAATAIRAVEALAEIRGLAAELGLTPLELVGMALQEPSSNEIPPVSKSLIQLMSRR
ncbi:hypothetical protein [Nocardia sp. NPDC050435]|uniref:hypothetical protein n=1 Tax=Nocardia sp. NPDC050435 TaxID=3155040 RepID=UPI0033DC01F7